MTVNSGFESCFFNLPDSSQELNIDTRALKEVNVAVRQILVEDQDREKRGPYKSLAFTPLQRVGKYAARNGQYSGALKQFHIPHILPHGI